MTTVAKTLESKLNEIVEYSKKDPRISAIWLVGSMATGEYDEFSDIDLYILIPEEHYSEVYSERESFVQSFGKILSTFEVKWDNCDLFGVIYDIPIEVDYCFTRPSQIEIFAPYKILHDRTHDLENLLSQSYSEYKVNKSSFSTHEIKSQFSFFAYNLLHAINKLGRGDLWAAIRQIEIMRKRIITVIGYRNGVEISEEYTGLNTYLSTNEIDLLKGTLCEYNTNSIKNSIKLCSQLFESLESYLYKDKGINYNHDLHKVMLQRLEQFELN